MKSKDGFELNQKAGSVPVLRIVGTIKNNVKAPFLSAGHNGINMQGEINEVRREIRKQRGYVSDIIIDEELIRTLDGIEGFSHLIVLYWGHKVPEKSRHLTRVHPMGRKELPLTGIFSTCSPARPNPLLLTVVRLLERKDNILKVADLDAVDGSPVIDIKPYLKDSYCLEDSTTPGWMSKLIEEIREKEKE
ncbi:MAG: tRNA (N6-threonylcarbamoyladenosine(37)-N6)-methyltransferase TrmO [Deltaproteobacteria bacterium]|nr:tRNA (N6-threonylcarbamoyladenosine(37)-N6)-methyltransferase TrmO [Deltaproteobacteria bacterium]